MLNHIISGVSKPGFVFHCLWFNVLVTAGLIIKCSGSEEAIKMVGNAQRSFGCLTEKSICKDSHQLKDHLLHILRLFSKAELGRKPQTVSRFQICISVLNLQHWMSLILCLFRSVFLFSDFILKNLNISSPADFPEVTCCPCWLRAGLCFNH